MRKTSFTSLFGLLVLLLSFTWGATPAAAQTAPFTIGTCIGTDGFTFSPGLTNQQQFESFQFQAIFTGCAYVTTDILSAPVPAFATWNSTLANGGCLSLNNQVAPGSGTLIWSDETTSQFVLTTAVSIGVGPLSPNAAFFKLVSGTGAGGYFVANTDLLPTVGDALNCVVGKPLYILTGINVPIYVALPLSL